MILFLVLSNISPSCFEFSVSECYATKSSISIWPLKPNTISNIRHFFSGIVLEIVRASTSVIHVGCDDDVGNHIYCQSEIVMAYYQNIASIQCFNGGA